jgi:hypothetical protein
MFRAAVAIASARNVLFIADSDEAARVYRAYSAHRSNLMTPTILI